jgi:hypothetical protein
LTSQGWRWAAAATAARPLIILGRVCSHGPRGRSPAATFALLARQAHNFDRTERVEQAIRASQLQIEPSPQVARPHSHSVTSSSPAAHRTIRPDHARSVRAERTALPRSALRICKGREPDGWRLCNTPRSTVRAGDITRRLASAGNSLGDAPEQDRRAPGPKVAIQTAWWMGHRYARQSRSNNHEEPNERIFTSGRSNARKTQPCGRTTVGRGGSPCSRARLPMS